MVPGGYILLQHMVDIITPKKKMHGARWLHPATTHGGYNHTEEENARWRDEASNILSLRKRGGTDVKNCCVLHTQFYK